MLGQIGEKLDISLVERIGRIGPKRHNACDVRCSQWHAHPRKTGLLFADYKIGDTLQGCLFTEVGEKQFLLVLDYPAREGSFQGHPRSIKVLPIIVKKIKVDFIVLDDPDEVRIRVKGILNG